MRVNAQLITAELGSVCCPAVGGLRAVQQLSTPPLTNVHNGDFLFLWHAQKKKRLRIFLPETSDDVEWLINQTSLPPRSIPPCMIYCFVCKEGEVGRHTFSSAHRGEPTSFPPIFFFNQSAGFVSPPTYELAHYLRVWLGTGADAELTQAVQKSANWAFRKQIRAAEEGKNEGKESDRDC